MWRSIQSIISSYYDRRPSWNVRVTVQVTQLEARSHHFYPGLPVSLATLAPELQQPASPAVWLRGSGAGVAEYQSQLLRKKGENPLVFSCSGRLNLNPARQKTLRCFLPPLPKTFQFCFCNLMLANLPSTFGVYCFGLLVTGRLTLTLILSGGNFPGRQAAPEVVVSCSFSKHWFDSVQFNSTQVRYFWRNFSVLGAVGAQHIISIFPSFGKHFSSFWHPTPWAFVSITFICQVHSLVTVPIVWTAPHLDLYKLPSHCSG